MNGDKQILSPILYGIEMECVIPHSNYSFEVGGYRDRDSSCKVGKWYATSDSSIYSHGDMGVEFVSQPLEETQIKGALKQLQKEIPQCPEFNDSTGCHVHVSCKDSALLDACKGDQDKTAQFFETFNRTLFPAVKQVLGEERYVLWRGRYYRSYAREFRRNSSERYQALNLNSSTRKTVEFRGFHLYQVKTWDEVESMLNAFVKAFNSTLAKYSTWEVASKRNVPIVQWEVREFEDRIVIPSRERNTIKVSTIERKENKPCVISI